MSALSRRRRSPPDAIERHDAGVRACAGPRRAADRLPLDRDGRRTDPDHIWTSPEVARWNSNEFVTWCREARLWSDPTFVSPQPAERIVTRFDNQIHRAGTEPAAAGVTSRVEELATRCKLSIIDGPLGYASPTRRGPPVTRARVAVSGNARKARSAIAGSELGDAGNIERGSGPSADPTCEDHRAKRARLRSCHVDRVMLPRPLP